MIPFLKTTIAAVFLFLFLSEKGSAQAGKDPLSYMSYIGNEFKSINNDMWDYISAVSHDKKARKIESRRKDLVKTLLSAKDKISKMSDYNGDGSYRDSVVSFLKISYYVINEDYGKLVDMGEIAEESYDNMEAYMLAQQRANDKLDEANNSLEREEEAFAKTYNINLVQSADNVNANLEKAGKVFDYYNKVYLIFFKSSKQETYVVDAMNKNDVNAIEQNMNTLATYAPDGLAKLDTIKSFKEDNSLKLACKEMLEFYKQEANEKIPILVDFYLKKENFDKIKSAYNTNSQSERTQADVDQFNKGVNDYNDALKKFNAVNDELNKKRDLLFNKWNTTSKTFLDSHVPKKK